MTDAQLYLAIGIPSALFALNFLAVLATGFWQAKRFDDMKEMFRADNASLRSDIQRVEATLTSELKRVEGVLGAKIDGLDVRVKPLENEIRTPLVKQ
jgi:hypothetical protein